MVFVSLALTEERSLVCHVVSYLSAPRMLDEYFEEQMKEIIRMCSHHRQTMLFSATMTDEVGQGASPWWICTGGRAKDPAGLEGLPGCWCPLPTSSQEAECPWLCAWQVKDLASVSLKNPVRVFVNSNTDVAPFLRQEFIRIRPNREGDREAIVAGEGPGLGRLGGSLGLLSVHPKH